MLACASLSPRGVSFLTKLAQDLRKGKTSNLRPSKKGLAITPSTLFNTQLIMYLIERLYLIIRIFRLITRWLIRVIKPVSLLSKRVI
jgi:hypothetical protein